MISLTTPVTIPNLARIRATRVVPTSDDGSSFQVFVRAHILAGPARGIDHVLHIRNGLCDVLRVNPSPTQFDDALFVARDSITVATGADQIEAAARTGANRAAMLRSVEAALQTIGCFETPTLNGTVS